MLLKNENLYVNIAAYKFIFLKNAMTKRSLFLKFCQNLNLRGSIILSPEGINLFLCGLRSNINIFLNWLRTEIYFKDIDVKESFSKKLSFNRMLVKFKPEIITIKYPLIQTKLKLVSYYVTSRTLKHWLDQGYDNNNKQIVMIDVRNKFEINIGTFKNSINYHISRFSEFPKAIITQKTTLAGKTIIIFCTGGIRCEKAAIFMRNAGYNNIIYQLQGGILKYFKEIGNAHYTGDCFVFDNRIALNPQLEARYMV